MAQKMLFDQELVKEDKLGAFTLKTDLGAPIRKHCFSFLSKLVQSEYFNVNIFIEPIINRLDDTEETVRFTGFKILNFLTQKEGHV